ncbi:uncharacterized protein CIMG_04101 [Coccidioides immitis RS]|uniref:Uncharacterized protein n=1 Tax=Coccidioides immitis (strain RS) TaxID=246410 RepID=J3KCS7_COCIM|nr:uncharacterized protein CIMG_04101 [Coccidioides immitis RS]EAS33077.3 hypothetical protein CIMG_04101 [Coccidioides immitis RS]
MGIPLVYEPVASRTEQNFKPDPSAVARSSIRRQNAIRRPRRNGAIISNSRNNRGSSTRWPLPHMLDAFTREAEREVNSRGSRSPRSNVSPTDDLGTWNSLNSITRHEMGQHLLRDSLRYSSPGHRMRIPRESSLRFEMPRPYWYGDFPQPAVPQVPRSRNAETSERVYLTPRFAPAHPVDGETISRSSTASPATVPNDGPDSNMPLLRRVGHRSVAASERRSRRRHVVDGLGDRERSLGPEEDEMHDSWETLLTTITPDDQLPSLDSSFTSATASASSALSRNSGPSNSSTSSQTPLTSFGPDSPRMRITFDDPFPEFSPNCEFLSSDSGSDTEAESEPDASMRVPGAMFGFTITRSSGPREGDQERRSQDRNDDSNNDTPVTSTSASFSSQSMHPDLQEVHAILDRLVRRDDIPDEWWATAGLSRTIRRELNNASTEDQDD